MKERLETGKTFASLDEYKRYYNSLPDVETSDGRILSAHTWFYRSMLVRDTVEKLGGDSIFDIGVHTGIVSLNLAKQLGMSVLGIDINEKAVQFCLGLCQRNALKNCEFHVAAYEEYVTDKKFDYIIVQEIIEHVIDPENLLQYAERHCSEAGVVIVTTPEWDSPYGVSDKNPDHQWCWRADEFRDYISSRGEIIEFINNKIIYVVYKPWQK